MHEMTKSSNNLFVARNRIFHPHLLSPQSLLNRSLNSSHHSISILHIKRHHMLRPVIMEPHFTRLTQPGQMHARRIQLILLSHNIRRGDLDRILALSRSVRDDFIPRAVKRRSTADEHGDLEQRFLMRLRMVYNHGACQGSTLRESHDGVERTLTLDDIVDVLHCWGEVFARCAVTRIMVVKGAIKEAL